MMGKKIAARMTAVGLLAATTLSGSGFTAQAAPDALFARAGSPMAREALRVAPAPGLMPHAAPFISPRTVPGFAAPTIHTQQAHDPDSDYTSRWTRADARQIVANSNPDTATGTSSLPGRLTMPDIPLGFPATDPNVWVWDTWTLIDKNANQISYNGWEVIFSLTAQRYAGYGFDDRHVNARLGYFYRRANVPLKERPANGGWIYGGNVFPDGASAKVAGSEPFTQNAQWSGSTRLLTPGSNDVQFFYTDLFFNRDSQGGNITPPDAIISTAIGKIHADFNHVWFTGLDNHIPLLRPDGKYYQSGAQNQYFSFRDPFTFQDPKHPGVNYMVFEGNSAGVRGETPCDAADLGYRSGDPYAETVDAVNASGAIYQRANIGLAVADNASMTKWHFLPPLISANCVNDQTERPQMFIKDGKYYVFTISHRTTYASGMDGPDGVYGFVGNGIRSDFQPMNFGSGLVLGNPTDLNVAAGTDFDPQPGQDPRAFQSYSHYVMKSGLMESFIDTVEGRRGGSLVPTVKISFQGASSAIDLSYGKNGLGAYANIPANKLDVDWSTIISDVNWPALMQTDWIGAFYASDWPYYTGALLKNLRNGGAPLPTGEQFGQIVGLYNSMPAYQQTAVQIYLSSH